MSTKFFTNDGENTLLKKFDGIFKYTNVFYFDALVGYFRSSGYFKIREHLSQVKKIRILVGIDVDQLISQAALKGLEFNFNSDITKEEFLKDLKNDIQCALYKKEIEEGILEFIEDIVNGKIEIKAHPDKNIHAKIYVFRPEIWNEHNSGSVITGSSNLSEAGLDRNFEFNVELRDYDDVVYANKTFENLWAESINILATEISNLKKETYLNTDFTPFEIYIKLLITYFGNSIEYDPESITDLPKGYKKLAYQIDAVNDGFAKLMKHNGFILADVVGLGKTIIATIITKKFYFSNGYRTKTLVIHPPALGDNWKKTMRDFEVPNVDYVTNGSLHKVKHPEDYDLIIVDEAHKFRSDESEMFNELQKLCKTERKRPGINGANHKKVMLVTATPLNNKPEDIRNQLYLFQDSKKSTLEVGNLQHFFRPLIDEYKKLKRELNHEKIAHGVKRIYDEIRVKVLESIIVRRTRTDIRNTPAYWEDIKQQGVTFPDIEPPRQILYQLDEQLNELYDHTFDIIKDTQNGLGYFRYQAIKYLNPDAKKQYKQANLISEQLAHIMRILLVKRIDSSFFAFKMSLARYYDANRAMLKMIENDKIYIAPKIPISDFILEDNEDKLEELLRNTDNPEIIQQFKVEDFSDIFIKGIKKDNEILKKLNEAWSLVNSDPKYDTFLQKLKSEFLIDGINDNKKLVVFSESRETTDYIFNRLKQDGIEKVLSVNSSNQKELTKIIAKNFDANQLNILDSSDYNIIITTEVLAEGVNLHLSNVIINYDIPWNATKLMQRIGRVNRIGTRSSKIFIYNFFPTVKTDSEIELNKKAYMKLQAFHSALGEDSQIYSVKEEFSTFGLFEKLPSEEKDERLEYLNFIRQFKDQFPDIYERIKKKIPERGRVGRKDAGLNDQTVTFIRNKRRDAFYLIKPDLFLEELTFTEAARLFKAQADEKSIPLHHLHHQHINEGLNCFHKESDIVNLGDIAPVKLGPNEKRALAFISHNIELDFVSSEERTLLDNAKIAIKKGRFQKLPREINQLMKGGKDGAKGLIDVYSALIKIVEKYPVVENLYIQQASSLPKKIEMPKIILSESFSS
ncbi:helicase-related protein [Mucilaginibacter sp.]|uniref:helicase-related protein n=1 Tax=Mucilaginibacter sp. TaxID=1882438 RepID=UPI0025D76C72|nr:helicase-related protein [Mucilaginibacter sp.]